MHWEDRINNYVRETGFPRSLFIAEGGCVVGTWIMGNSYHVGSGYYGGYPAGYLRRVRALFPDKRRVLHLFSGKVDLKVLPGDTVDINADWGRPTSTTRKAWSACTRSAEQRGETPCPIRALDEDVQTHS